MKQVDTEDNFDYWLNRAKPGETVVYYDGFLLMDRERLVNNGIFADKFPQTIKAAIRAWKAYQNGHVTLVQKKRDFFAYDYIAIKR